MSPSPLYVFLPHSVEHILGNLVMQLLLGIPLELVHKGFEVGMVYMAGVLAGGHRHTPPFSIDAQSVRHSCLQRSVTTE